MSATFIYREIIELKRRGVKIITYSIRRPDINSISNESRHFLDTTTYLLPVNLFLFFKAHLYFLLFRPFQYLNTVFFLLTRKYDNPLKDRRRTIFHFCEAVYLAKLMQREGNISHIHAHYASHPATLALVAARFLGINYSFTGHASDIWTDRLFVKEKVHSAKFVITCTIFGRNYILNLVGEGYSNKIRTVYHGIDLKRFSPSELTPGSSCGILRILNIGRLSPEKAHANLIKACRLLKDNGLNFQCDIIGDGPLFNSLNGLILELDLKREVRLLGKVFQENIFGHFLESDIFVLSSIRENLPNVLLESMAMGVPVIATELAGIPELIKDGSNGFLTPPGDISCLASRIMRLANDHGLRQGYSENGRKTVEEHFDQSRSIDKILEIYKYYEIVDQDSA